MNGRPRAGWSSGHLIELGVPAIILLILSAILLPQLDVMAPASPNACPTTFETSASAAPAPLSGDGAVVLEAWIHVSLRLSDARAEMERRPTWFDRLVVCPMLALFGFMLVGTGALAACQGGAPWIERFLSAGAALVGIALFPIALALASYSQVLTVDGARRALQVRTTWLGLKGVERDYPVHRFALRAAGSRASAYAILDVQERECVWLGRLSEGDRWVPGRLDRLLRR